MIVTIGPEAFQPIFEPMGAAHAKQNASDKRYAARYKGYKGRRAKIVPEGDRIGPEGYAAKVDQNKGPVRCPEPTIPRFHTTSFFVW
jgi:hypothetical protein